MSSTLSAQNYGLALVSVSIIKNVLSYINICSVGTDSPILAMSTS